MSATFSEEKVHEIGRFNERWRFRLEYEQGVGAFQHAFQQWRGGPGPGAHDVGDTRGAAAPGAQAPGAASRRQAARERDAPHFDNQPQDSRRRPTVYADPYSRP